MTFVFPFDPGDFDMFNLTQQQPQNPLLLAPWSSTSYFSHLDMASSLNTFGRISHSNTFKILFCLQHGVQLILWSFRYDKLILKSLGSDETVTSSEPFLISPWSSTHHFTFYGYFPKTLGIWSALIKSLVLSSKFSIALSSWFIYVQFTSPFFVSHQLFLTKFLHVWICVSPLGHSYNWILFGTLLDHEDLKTLMIYKNKCSLSSLLQVVFIQE